ncbi:MAG: tRNA 2-selenouridine(34) synthase MnmH [Planctomycetota bacterium]|nr:MAG: tRNA 2-selenouridine(34) synthase MnmH [Planctomycetota bacterium]
MDLPTLAYAEAVRLPGVEFVDLRSPSEFAHDHLPGARNVPLFDDRQRAVVGTLYCRESPAAAWREGLRIVEERLAGLLAEILGEPVPDRAWRRRFHELTAPGRDPAFQREFRWLAPSEPPPAPLVLHCWRGGMRSRSVVALMHALGIHRAIHLAGGYKGYRAWVRERLAAFDPATPLIVLRGPTGVGKTRILARLEEAAPGATIDLEGLARHRSSILGDVGLEPVGQKAFESALADRLGRLGPPPWFIEGESRKVGDVVLPEPLFRAMEEGIQIRLDAPLAHRVEVLAADYLPTPAHAAELRARLPFLEKRLGRTWTGRLRAWLDRGEWRRVAEVLLERYYDPRYGHHDRRRRWAAEFNAADPGLVADLLAFRARRGGRGASAGG